MSASASRVRHVAVINNTSIYIHRFRREFISSLVQDGIRVTILCPQDSATPKLLDLGAGILPIPMQQHGTSPRAELRVLLALFQALRRIRPEAVVNFTLKPAIYGSIAARAAGVGSIHSVFTGLGYYFTEEHVQSSMQARVIRALLRMALPLNRRIVFQNRDDRDLMSRYGLVKPQNTVIVAGSGVDLVRFGQQPVPAGSEVFLLVGRMLREKGVREFVEAARWVKERHPHVRFRLLGGIDGSSSAIPREELEKWVHQDLVEWLGEVDDVRSHLATATAVVLPSYREGLPRSVLEALAIGRPIVTTDVPGCRETVVDGINGYLVPPRNAIALAEAIGRLVGRHELAVRMGAASRLLALERFDVRLINEQLRSAVGLSDT